MVVQATMRMPSMPSLQLKQALLSPFVMISPSSAKRTQPQGRMDKSKRQRYTVGVTPELRGYATKMKDGKNVCFAFHLSSGCPNGHSCTRGAHVCMTQHELRWSALIVGVLFKEGSLRV
eukprot:4183168-Amphidinium_carterae.1